MEAAETGQPAEPAQPRRLGRRTAVAVLLILATIFTTAMVFGLWAQRQALNTDNWVTTSDRLLRDVKIRTALANYLVDQLTKTKPLQTRLEEELPSQLKPLAEPLSAGLREVARRNAPRVLGSTAALTAWEQANRTAHKRFKDVIEGKVAKGGEVNLDVKSLLGQVAENAGLPSDAVDKLPESVAQIQIMKSDQIKAAQDGLDTARGLWITLVLLTLILYGAAIWLSPDRRRTVAMCGVCFLVAGIAALAVRRLGNNVVVDSLAKSANGRDAAHEAWLIGTSLLRDAAQGSLLIGLFLLSGAWVAGPGRRATALRRISAPALRDQAVGVRVGLGVLILLLILWAPVPWTTKFIPLLVFTVAAFVWLEWVRRRTLEEFPDVPAGEWSRSWRNRVSAMRSLAPNNEWEKYAEIERLGALRDRGLLDEAEFEREKEALLARHGS